MRMILHAVFPHEQFNAAVKDGTIADKLGRIMEDAKPEAVYFAEFDGRRSCLMIINMTNASQMAHYAEPFFLAFHADVHFRPTMTPGDLKEAGLEALGKKWA